VCVPEGESIVNKKKCFVIMPFSGTESIKTEEEWTEIYECLFIPAWEKFDYECERTDVPRGSIKKDILEKLFSADFVFADLTDSNPNVMYELGVRHSFRKPSMMVKLKGCEIPFDVDDYKVHNYETGLSGLKKLQKIINSVVVDLESEPNRIDNPVWDFLHYGGFMVDYYRDIQIKNKLNGLLIETEKNEHHIRKLVDVFLLTEKNDEIEFVTKILKEYVTHLWEISADCINLLISTNYLSFKENQMIVIYKYYGLIKACSTLLNFFTGSTVLLLDADKFLKNPVLKILAEEYEETLTSFLSLIQNKKLDFEKS